MSKGIGSDLRERLAQAHTMKTCIYPRSASDARQLRRACIRADLVSPAPRIYALPDHWSSLSRLEQEQCKLRTLAQLHPTWVFASFSAAVLYGLSVSYRRLDVIHVRCTRQSHSRSSRKIVRHVITNDEITEVNGIQVTSIARTLFDTINSSSFSEGLALADSVLRTTDMKSSELVRLLEPMRGHYLDSWRAKETAALANGLAESGGESIARATMIANGYMPPELQVGIPDLVNPSEEYRVDFYWRLPSGNIIGEMDGREKYKNPVMTNGLDAVDVFANERLRESRLTGSGSKVMRFSYRDVVNTRKFCHILTSFGIPSGYGIPRVASY